MKIKVDNLGCDRCRIKAVRELTKHGAQKVDFDMQKNFIIVDPGPLSKKKVEDIIEWCGIDVESGYSDHLILYVDLTEFAVKELTRAFKDKVVQFDMEAGTITFESNTDEYEVVEIVELYGYKVKRVQKPF